MDKPLFGTLLAGIAFAPWVIEVALQVRLQSRFLTTLPAADRAALPPHPRRAWLGFLGSTRFQLAVWRSFRRTLPHDTPPVAALKRRMRASLRREIVFAIVGTVVLLALLRAGWRPWT